MVFKVEGDGTNEANPAFFKIQSHEVGVEGDLYERTKGLCREFSSSDDRIARGHSADQGCHGRLSDACGQGLPRRCGARQIPSESKLDYIFDGAGRRTGDLVSPRHVVRKDSDGAGEKCRGAGVLILAEQDEKNDPEDDERDAAKFFRR